jgi:hypothetical protein
VTRVAVFEVNTYVELKDAKGFRHFLGPGKDIPEWVSEEQIASLLDSGAITRFEVI